MIAIKALILTLLYVDIWPLKVFGPFAVKLCSLLSSVIENYQKTGSHMRRQAFNTGYLATVANYILRYMCGIKIMFYQSFTLLSRGGSRPKYFHYLKSLYLAVLLFQINPEPMSWWTVSWNCIESGMELLRMGKIRKLLSGMEHETSVGLEFQLKRMGW